MASVEAGGMACLLTSCAFSQTMICLSASAAEVGVLCRAGQWLCLAHLRRDCGCSLLPVGLVCAVLWRYGRP